MVEAARRAELEHIKRKLQQVRQAEERLQARNREADRREAALRAHETLLNERDGAAAPGAIAAHPPPAPNASAAAGCPPARRRRAGSAAPRQLTGVPYGAASLAAKEAERGGLAQGLAAREGEVLKLTRELQVCCRAPGQPPPADASLCAGGPPR